MWTTKHVWRPHECAWTRPHGASGLFILDGCRRSDWQDDFRGDLPVLSDLDSVDDHQKWPGRSVVPRIGDRDIHRRIGFREVMSQADSLEP